MTAAYFNELSAFDCDNRSRPADPKCVKLEEITVRGHGLRRLWRLFAEQEDLHRPIEVTPSVAQRFIRYVSEVQVELHHSVCAVRHTLWSLPHVYYS